MGFAWGHIACTRRGLRNKDDNWDGMRCLECAACMQLSEQALKTMHADPYDSVAWPDACLLTMPQFVVQATGMMCRDMSQRSHLH